ncbi:MAG: hypothetical protein GY894_00205 [Planctomycetes bacterium]|nr:hypothetical protein [Planctomycetota bacterium]
MPRSALSIQLVASTSAGSTESAIVGGAVVAVVTLTATMGGRSWSRYGDLVPYCGIP